MKIDIGTRNFEVDGKIRDYAQDKLRALEKYLPRRSRGVAMVQATLEEDVSGREDNRFVCEAVMTVPGETLVSREGTVNMFAAVDIVEAKLKTQLVRYKDKHTLEPRRNRMVAKWLEHQGRLES